MQYVIIDNEIYTMITQSLPEEVNFQNKTN